MADREKWLELAERCGQAAGPDNWLSADIGVAFNIHGDKCPHYTASLDAAMTLVPEGWDWSAVRDRGDYSAQVYEPVWSALQHGAASAYKTGIIEASTPALALCAAALRARVAHTKSENPQ
jgi:hypothetical protein